MVATATKSRSPRKIQDNHGAPRKKEINWNASKDEIKVIHKIGARAIAMYEKAGVKRDLIDIEMDITACHLNGNPLDLDKLLHADDFNFAHDIGGIGRHISRVTGELTGFFIPRCSKREGK